MIRNRLMFAVFVSVSALRADAILFTTAPGGAYASNAAAMAAWEAALLNGTVLSSLDLSGFDGLYGSSYTSGGLTFTGNPNIFGAGGNLLANSLITISTGSGVSGIEFTLGCASNCQFHPMTVSVTDASGATYTVYNSATAFPGSPYYGNYPWTINSAQFFGITSTSPIVQVVADSRVSAQLVNITISEVTTAEETPEPPVFIPLGLGVAAIALREVLCSG